MHPYIHVIQTSMHPCTHATRTSMPPVHTCSHTSMPIHSCLHIHGCVDGCMVGACATCACACVYILSIYVHVHVCNVLCTCVNAHVCTVCQPNPKHNPNPCTQDMCKRKALNHHFSDKNDLYDEFFGCNKDGGDEDEGETEEERKNRLRTHHQNRSNWGHYLDKNMADLLIRELLRTAEVPSKRDFNAHHHRPLVLRTGVVAALEKLGVNRDIACDIADTVPNYPAPVDVIVANICEHTCTGCKQHELKDGSKIPG